MADLNAALGRGVSTSEAKAWVRALDRLGKGLSREKLLEACLVREDHLFGHPRGLLLCGSCCLPFAVFCVCSGTWNNNFLRAPSPRLAGSRIFAPLVGMRYQGVFVSFVESRFDPFSPFSVGPCATQSV